VALLITVGGILAAWWYDQWPFNLRGPLRRYAHGADGFIYSDPDFVAAETAEDAKDFARLLKNAKQLVADYPDNSLAHYILGVACGEMNFFADAASCFPQAIKLKPDYVDAWNNLGWAYSKLGKFADAAAVFEQLIKFTPRDAQVWSNLGGARAGQGREADAIAAYQKANQLKPDYADAHFNLGVAYAS
jgi:tetratricopeptide (TPR) repeat protein